mgnify:CR=1 FL=1
MTHLRNRLSLVPFCDLTNAPEEGHHAIGSPYFDPLGRPLFPEPVIVAVRADIVDPILPSCTALTASCHTRPYHAYGPVMRRVFEKSEPHKYPEVRRGLEGVIDVGQVRKIPPGGLHEQTEHILLACVNTMTLGTNRNLLDKVLGSLTYQFSKLPAGSTMRMPLIGTGKARFEEPTEQDLKDVIQQVLSHFAAPLFDDHKLRSPRRLLIVHPFDYESRVIATALAEKGIFLTLLDKMGLSIRDKRMVYGIAFGDDKSHQIVSQEHFDAALDHLDQALDYLLEGKCTETLKEAAKAIELEPALGGLYIYIRELTQKPESLIAALTEEAVQLAAEGRIYDAYSVAKTINRLGGSQKDRRFLQALEDCAMDYCVAGLESRLMYENYMHVEELIRAFQKNDPRKHLQKCLGDDEHDLLEHHNIPLPPEEDNKAIELILKKIPKHLLSNTYHIVVRKLMADQAEPLGAKQALENVLQLQEHQKFPLSDKDRKICDELLALSNAHIEKRIQFTNRKIRDEILQELIRILPEHATLRIEAARYYLRGGINAPKEGPISVTRRDIAKAWEHIEHGLKANPQDHGLLCYVGFILLLQGKPFLEQAHEFYMLFTKLVKEEVQQGYFAVQTLHSPRGKDFVVPIRDRYSQMAHNYHQGCLEHAEGLRELMKALTSPDEQMHYDLYHKAMVNYTKVRRYDLYQLQERTLGERWVAMLTRSRKSLGSIPLPFFGEISVGVLMDMYKRFRLWWRYRKLQSEELYGAIEQLIARLKKEILS